ncbi:hypothetical protein [Amycolatopsis silviterrae]|uniref:AAA family ATPase n=1 Tax=Amycolatopsis silviterrae TaxID=1656914 RepID=A0ABW5HKT8_9PSEU
MRAVLLGGAPGIGKSAVARALLKLAESGPGLVQWADVDALWLHQPWRVDDRMKAMVQANLRAVAANAAEAGVDVLLITWVFQSAEMRQLVTALLPPGTPTISVQLRGNRDTWQQRFAADQARPEIDAFFRARYEAAQTTPADHFVDTDHRDVREVARRVAAAAGLGADPPDGAPEPAA